MQYQFPEIRHLDDVRAAIEGRDEFIIAERAKAETPEAKARAEADRQKVLNGLESVKALFNL